MWFVDQVVIYTDGSYCAQRGAYAYGWVAANATPLMTSARVVGWQGAARQAHGSCLMESRAIVDALAEFAHRNVRVIIYADNQALAQKIEKIKAGELAPSSLLSMPTVITENDARRLLSILSFVDFELRWVKAHRDNFYNLVVDHMCRMAGIEQMADEEAVAWACTALQNRSARVWSKLSRIENDETVWYNGYREVFA